MRSQALRYIPPRLHHPQAPISTNTQRRTIQTQMSNPSPRMPPPRVPNGTRRLGQFTTLSFLSFCGIFAAAAIILDRTSPKPTKKLPNNTRKPTTVSDYDTLMSDGTEPPPPRIDEGDDDPTNPKQPPNQGGPTQPDYFNRHQRVRIPYVIRSLATAERAQATAQARTSQQTQRQAAKEDRNAATRARQQDVQRRQQEMERFTESRMLAQDVGGRDQTPRGRGPERLPLQVRQRSASTASSASDSSFSDFWDERGR